MRHLKNRYQLNRFTSFRKATLLSMLKNLLIQQSIRTTKTKAKAVKPLADKLIALAKKNTLAAKRKAYQLLGDHKLVRSLFNDIALRFDNRTGGFTRILNTGNRRGDNAQTVIFELTEIKKPKKEAAAAKGKEAKVSLPEQPSEAEIIKEKKPKEIPPQVKKPTKKFLGGLRNIFKKERDSL